MRDWCTTPELIQHVENVDDDSGGGVDGLEFSPRDRPDRCLRLRSYPLFSPRDQNEVHGSLTVLEDITTEVMARKARTEFVAKLAHELKTPLHVIGMYAETLAGPESEEEAYRLEAANVIGEEVHRVSALIRNMLDVTRIEMGSIQIERTRTRLRDLLESVCTAHSRTAEEAGISIELDLASDPGTVYVDKALLRTALDNLVSNAVKYSDPGARVEVSVESTDERLVIVVRDQGIGMSGEDQLRVFDKFFRSDNPAVRNRSGHGLGLAMCREIVELHNGRLAVSSTLGQGSEFRIELDRTMQLLREAI